MRGLNRPDRHGDRRMDRIDHRNAERGLERGTMACQTRTRCVTVVDAFGVSWG